MWMEKEDFSHRFTRLLMLDAVPYSSESIFVTCATCDFGGMMSEIMLVPFLNGTERQGNPKGNGFKRKGKFSATHERCVKNNWTRSVFMRALRLIPLTL